MGKLIVQCIRFHYTHSMPLAYLLGAGLKCNSWVQSTNLCFCVADAGGVQGTEGDLSVDNPDFQPANDEPMRPAPPELPPQDLQRYKQTIAGSLKPDETVLTALRFAAQSQQG